MEQVALEAHPGKHLSVLLFKDVTNAKCAVSKRTDALMRSEAALMHGASGAAEF